MVGLLIIFAVMGLGFGSGYAVRAIISRRRRRTARRNAAKGHGRRREAPAADAARDNAINLERLLGAANESTNRSLQQADRSTTDELDGAVRDLLGELGRRASGPSAARRVRQ